MNKEELAKHIKDRIEIIGTAFKYMESIQKKCIDNEEFYDAFIFIYLSLQNYVYTELFKIFDSNGKGSRENSIYTLMHMLETNDKKYHNKMSKYKDDIDSIKKRRNHYFAHDTGENISDIFEQNRILRLQVILETLTEICCDANNELLPNTYVNNINCFNDWCTMAINSLNEVCVLNDKLISASVPKEMYEENLDSFINHLKKCRKEIKKYENSTNSGHNS